MSFIRTCVSHLHNSKKANSIKQEALLLQLLFIDRNLNEIQIAEILRMDVNEVKRKLIENNITHPTGHILNDSFMGIYTGAFHATKAKLINILKIAKESSNIIKQTDEISAQTLSINALVLKKIINKMETLDQDTGESAGAALGLTRAQTLYKGLKFGLVLEDIDVFYSERGDYLLKKIIEHKDEFYFDQQSEPENWHPNRDSQMCEEYIFGKTYGKEKLESMKKENNNSTGIKLS